MSIASSFRRLSFVWCTISLIGLLALACSGGGGGGGNGGGGDDTGGDVGDGGGGEDGGGEDGGVPVTLASLAVTPGSAVVGVGSTRAFVATGTYSDGTTKDLTASATWTSSDAAVATVAAGVASAVKQGTASIMASVEGAPAAAAELRVAAVVNSAADTVAVDGKCTLREALLNAAAKDQSGSADCPAGTEHSIVAFDLDTPATITIGSTLPAIEGEVTILGPGAGLLTVSGAATSQILAAMGTGTLRLEALTLANGYASDGGAISISPGSRVSARAVAFRANVSARFGGAIFNKDSVLDLAGCAFAENSATGGGGAIGLMGGTVTVTNSTFSGNAAGNVGGGALLALSRDSVVTVSQSTFIDNASRGGGGAIGHTDSVDVGTFRLATSVFHGNVTSGSVWTCYTGNGRAIVDDGYNLEDGDSCKFGGTLGKNTDPLLGTLRGALDYAPLLAGSPAIDAIPAGTAGCGSAVTVDGRGIARPQGSGCDIGAYEYDAPQAGETLTVNRIEDEGDTCGQAYCTLRGAVYTLLARPQGSSATVRFGLPDASVIHLRSGLPAIAGGRTLAIEGPGARALTIDMGKQHRHLFVGADSTVSVADVTLAGGGGVGNGAAIYSEGALTVRRVAFRDNVAGLQGGAIRCVSGTLAVIGSSFLENLASGGAAIGISNGCAATVVNSTFVENGAGSLGGGAILVRDGELAVSYSTFLGNISETGGAAIGAESTSGNPFAVHLGASLLEGNVVGNTSVNCASTRLDITDDGYNLEDGTSCGFGASSYVETHALLAPFQDALGVAPLQAGSPAIDWIPSGAAGCGTTVAVDARGVARPQGTGCDIGAYERE